jgi:hypothetical protein
MDSGCIVDFVEYISVTEPKSAAWAGKVVASYMTKRLSQDVIQVWLQYLIKEMLS